MQQEFRQAGVWRIGCVAMCAVCLLFVIIYGVGSRAIASGWLPAPAIDVQIGPYHVLSRTTGFPNCAPLVVSCAAQVPRAAGVVQYYSIWVLCVTEVPSAGGIQIELN